MSSTQKTPLLGAGGGSSGSGKAAAAAHPGANLTGDEERVSELRGVLAL